MRRVAWIIIALGLFVLGIGWARVATSQSRPTPTAAALAVVATATPTASPTPSATAAPSPTITPSPAPAPSPTPPPKAPPLAARFAPLPGDRVTWVRSGVAHLQRVTDDPLRINVLLFDLTDPAFALAAAVGEGWLSGRHRTSTLAREFEALAAVNGDLFSADDGVPQGLTLTGGKILTAPKYRATFAWSPSSGPFIGYFTREWTWQAEVGASDGASAPVTLLNTRCPPEQICLFNEHARVVPGREGEVRAVLTATGVVSDVVRGARVTLGRGEQVLVGSGAGARWLVKHVVVGERLIIRVTTDPPLDRYREGISGGPIILREGAFVQDCLCALRDCSVVKPALAGPLCEDFSTDWKLRHYLDVRMPRTAIGFDRDRTTLVVAVVDGYQRGYSRGITQRELADLLREFGAATAMELDGGGSSTMVLTGKVVNRPPDETGERYVANALLFYWRDNE